jgi:hypothetical protein
MAGRQPGQWLGQLDRRFLPKNMLAFVLVKGLERHQLLSKAMIRLPRIELPGDKNFVSDVPKLHVVVVEQAGPHLTDEVMHL